MLLTIESAILNKKPTQHYPTVVTPLELYQTQLFTYVQYTSYNYRGLIGVRSALFWLTRALLWSAIEGQQGFQATRSTSRDSSPLFRPSSFFQVENPRELPHSKAINEEKIRIEIFSCFNRNFKVIGEEIIRSEVFSLL